MSILKKLHFRHRFWGSCSKVGMLLIFTFIPLAVNIAIAIIPSGCRIEAATEKIVPGEMLAYCLSLIAPLFLLLLKTHGDSFKIPALKPMFIISFVLYFLALILTIIAKNGLIDGIDLKSGHQDLYFWTSVSFLIIAILLRLYTDYQDSRFTDFKKEVEIQQKEFNKSFQSRLG